jgi:hypothetical protein
MLDVFEIEMIPGEFEETSRGELGTFEKHEYTVESDFVSVYFISELQRESFSSEEALIRQMFWHPMLLNFSFTYLH